MVRGQVIVLKKRRFLRAHKLSGRRYSHLLIAYKQEAAKEEKIGNSCNQNAQAKKEILIPKNGVKILSALSSGNWPIPQGTTGIDIPSGFAFGDGNSLEGKVIPGFG